MTSKRGGLMSLYGNWRPSTVEMPEPTEPMYKDARFMLYTYLTRRDAVAEILPEPLEPGPRPFVTIVVADYPHFLGFDGTNTPYNELIVLVECQFQGEVGVNIPYIYIGTRSGDFTEGSDVALCMGREGIGFPKKLANIHINKDGDEWRATLARKGTELVEYRATFEKEILPSESPVADFGRTIMVKEIMSANWQGFDVQQVWAGPTKWLTEPRIIRTGRGSIKLGELPGDPLNTLEVVEPGVALDIVNDLWSAIEPELLADLK